MYPNSIKNIIDCFKDLPGIGEKTAERLAFSLINFSKEKLTSFSDSIIDVRDKLTNCSICGNITENDICDICSDSNRNSKIVFVVEKAKDISLFEKINIYNGKYHVLGGLISPLEAIEPAAPPHTAAFQASASRKTTAPVFRQWQLCQERMR